MELRKINMQDAYAPRENTTAFPADENGLSNPYTGISYDGYHAIFQDTASFLSDTKFL